MDVDDVLEHHGIKGMHWGIRNKESLRRGPSSDHKKIAELRKRPVSSLTNNQLRDANARGNLEQQFVKMNPSKSARNHARVKAVLAVVGTLTSIAALADGPIAKLGRSVLAKKGLKIAKPRTFS